MRKQQRAFKTTANLIGSKGHVGKIKAEKEVIYVRRKKSQLILLHYWDAVLGDSFN